MVMHKRMYGLFGDAPSLSDGFPCQTLIAQLLNLCDPWLKRFGSLVSALSAGLLLLSLLDPGFLAQGFLSRPTCVGCFGCRSATFFRRAGLNRGNRIPRTIFAQTAARLSVPAVELGCYRFMDAPALAAALPYGIAPSVVGQFADCGQSPERLSSLDLHVWSGHASPAITFDPFVNELSSESALVLCVGDLEGSPVLGIGGLVAPAVSNRAAGLGKISEDQESASGFWHNNLQNPSTHSGKLGPRRIGCQIYRLPQWAKGTERILA